MLTRVDLCHVDTLRCVVRVEAWKDGQVLCSALGEAETSEQAEDRALERLQARLRINPSKSPTLVAAETSTDQQSVPKSWPTNTPQPTQQSLASSPRSDPSNSDQTHQTSNAPTPEHPSEAPSDPEDWSEELAAIDVEVRRIGWDREKERIYLERAFGHGSRHRLTRYADLVAFLRQLRAMSPGDRPESSSVPILRSDLIRQGDEMLQQLQWNAEQARGFLQQHLGATSRQKLSDDQLLQFNMLLEELIINANSNTPDSSA